MVKKYLLFLVLGIFLISLVSGSFQVGDDSHFLDLNYSKGETLSGWINLSFENESLSLLFFDSFGNNFSVQELIDSNSDIDYELNETQNTINSSFQKIYLDDLNLEIPNLGGNLTYFLNYSGTEIFSQNIFVQKSLNASLKVLAKSLIEEKKSELEVFNLELSKFDLFLQEKLNESFGFGLLEQKINSLESFYNNATNESDYNFIVSSLNELSIPKTIEVTKTIDNTEFFPSKDEINLGVISEVAGGSINGNEENYKGAIYLWNQENMNTKVTFKEISIAYENSKLFSLNYFKFDFGELPNNDVYFFIEDIDDLKFMENYSLSRAGRYSYLKLSSDVSTISFTTTEEVGFLDVPVIISPSLEILPTTELGDYVDSSKEVKISKWLLFSLAIVFLLILFFVVYSVLHTWYDKKYEKYLFPNRNDLYNLIIYINNAKKKGLSNEKISKNLKSSKWTGEQVRYVMRKYAGKRTGMALLPFMKKKIKKVGNHRNQSFKKT